MNLQTEYMCYAISIGRKIFRRQWGIYEDKPLWIKFGKEHSVVADNGKEYVLTAEDREANDWCIYGASKSEQKMFLNELTWDDVFCVTKRKHSE